MTDNEVIAVLYSIISQGLIEQGYTNTVVKQSNQPTMQGISTTSSVYFFKVGDRRYGWRRAHDDWDSVGMVMNHTESQHYETTFQLSALSIQNPANTSMITASDLVSVVAAILQSDATIQTLFNNGLGILRITDIRNPYFKDDRDEFEAIASFDFVVNYDRTRVITSPIIQSEELHIHSV